MNWSGDPLRDAEDYALERFGNVAGYCSACGGEIYGRSRTFDADRYILDDDGNMIHPTRKCMREAFGDKVFDWLLEEFGKKEMIDSMLDSMKSEERWLLEQCEERGWTN